MLFRALLGVESVLGIGGTIVRMWVVGHTEVAGSSRVAVYGFRVAESTLSATTSV